MSLLPLAETKEAKTKLCQTRQESWACPNMKEVENDTSMTYEHYECKICGRRMALDYDEMR